MMNTLAQSTSQKLMTLVMGVSAAFVLSFVLTGSSAYAAAPLMERVNEALREAEIPVNADTQRAFAAGVASGHYSSYDQLMNAMKWHKQQGRHIPEVKYVPAAKRVFKGTVTEVNMHTIELEGVNAQGVFVRPKFGITNRTLIKGGTLLIGASEEVRYEVTDEIRRGTQVEVIYTSGMDAVVIKNLAPVNQGDFYGPVDCSKCAGS